MERILKVAAFTTLLGLALLGMMAARWEYDYGTTRAPRWHWYRQFSHDCYVSQYYPYQAQPEAWCRIWP